MKFSSLCIHEFSYLVLVTKSSECMCTIKLGECRYDISNHPSAVHVCGTTSQNYGNKYILVFLSCTKAFEQRTRLNDMTSARFGTCIRTLIVAVLIPYGRRRSGGSESLSRSSLYRDLNFHRALSNFISIFLSRLFQRLYRPLKTKVAYTL